MIPADLASQLQSLQSLRLEQRTAASQPVQATQKIADVLSDLKPGERVLAEIQSQLPNGAYRAIIAQREITLALPFSAKAGDSLELEVVETDGKVTLAVVANRSSDGQTQSTQNSLASTLSQTGKLIGNLLAGIDDQGKRATPAALNSNNPLAEELPISAQNLAPILKEAISNSGVFYEAHQARWVDGQLTTSQLLQEPQGRHSTSTSTSGPVDTSLASRTQPATDSNIRIATSQAPAIDELANTAAKSQSSIPDNLVPLVQQQLDALATQTYAWQGQIWPGQQMSWEIDERQENSSPSDNSHDTQWQTRLKLNLPHLGSIEANVRLHPGNQLEITLSAEDTHSGMTLEEAASDLQQQFSAAGLNLIQLVVKNAQVTA
jgi:hypothetical protein